MKTLNGPRVRRISLVGKENVCGGKDLPKSQVLSSECVNNEYNDTVEFCTELANVSRINKPAQKL